MVSQERLWWGAVAFPGYAADHNVVRMDEVAFAFVMLYNSMVGCEEALSFGFTSLSKFLAGSPCHAVKNDARSVFCHLAILVNDSSCVPGIVDHLPGGFIALGKESLCIGECCVLGLKRPD